MIKHWFTFLALLLVVTVGAEAYDFSQGGLYYKVTDAGSHCLAVVHPSVDSYGYISGDLVIPDSVEYDSIMYAVTSIGYGAFMGCSELTSVVIPAGVTFIDSWAFSQCSGLTSVVFPEGLESIGTYAFRECTALTSINLGNSLKSIKDGAFFDCNNLTYVSLGSNLESIGQTGFLHCNILATIICHAEEPPAMGKHCIYSDELEIYVPCGSENAYKGASEWNRYKSRIYGTQFDFPFVYSFVSNDEEMGIVKVGMIGCDSTVTVTAIASAGHIFTGWSDGDLNNPRTMHISSDTTVTAMFATSEGVGDDVEDPRVKVYGSQGYVVVEGAEGQVVTLYDIIGHKLAIHRGDSASLHFDVPSDGIYLISIGNAPARRVVVVR